MDISIYPKKELLAKWDENKKWYKTAVGEPPKCLRCGHAMPLKRSHCALSRHIDVGICPECGTEEAMLDWDGKALPLRKWHAVLAGEVPPLLTDGEVTLWTTRGFSNVFEQPRREVWGHPSGFPMSELCYVRADHDGYRWHSTWTECQEKPKDPALLTEVDEFYTALIALPEFKNLHTLSKMCKSCAEQTAPEDSNTFNLYTDTPHFHIWLRLITRERDYNIYCNYYLKDWNGVSNQ